MVHYPLEQNMPANTPLLRCGKCGSPRTEVIGMSIDLKTTYLRCSSCGARGEVPARDPREAVVASK